MELAASASGVAREGRAFVQAHADGGVEEILDLDAALGRQQMLAAIDVGAELDSVLADLAQRRQAHDLEAAGIR